MNPKDEYFFPYDNTRLHFFSFPLNKPSLVFPTKSTRAFFICFLLTYNFTVCMWQPHFGFHFPSLPIDNESWNLEYRYLLLRATHKLDIDCFLSGDFFFGTCFENESSFIKTVEKVLNGRI